MKINEIINNAKLELEDISEKENKLLEFDGQKGKDMIFHIQNIWSINH